MLIYLLYLTFLVKTNLRVNLPVSFKDVQVLVQHKKELVVLALDKPNDAVVDIMSVFIFSDWSFDFLLNFSRVVKCSYYDRSAGVKRN